MRGPGSLADVVHSRLIPAFSRVNSLIRRTHSRPRPPAPSAVRDLSFSPCNPGKQAERPGPLSESTQLAHRHAPVPALAVRHERPDCGLPADAGLVLPAEVGVVNWRGHNWRGQGVGLGTCGQAEVGTFSTRRLPTRSPVYRRLCRPGDCADVGTSPSCRPEGYADVVVNGRAFRAV